MLPPAMGQLGFGFSVPDESARPKRPLRRSKPKLPSLGTQLPLTISREEPVDVMKPTIGGQAQLEAELRDLIDPYVMLKLTSNTSTMISFRRSGRVLYVRAHAMFAHAPKYVVQALARFVSQTQMNERDSFFLDDWIEQHRPALAEKKRAQPRQPVGEWHDLQAMFDRLNGKYFDTKIDAQITWSVARSLKRPVKKTKGRKKKGRRTTIKMGSYCDEQRLIRIHPALDQKFVPAYFVEFVVFHEMLHQVHGILEQECGRRAVHTAAFREDEARYAHFVKATRWEQRNLGRLLEY